MKLTLLNNTGTRVPKALFLPLLKRLSMVLPSVPQTEVELLLTTDEEIQQLNKLYRAKDKPTDVLSFTLDDPQTLGQLVISIPRAQEQAQQLGQSLQEELRFLFTHGLLHLLGYDHEDPADEKIMLKKTYALLGRRAPKSNG